MGRRSTCVLGLVAAALGAAPAWAADALEERVRRLEEQLAAAEQAESAPETLRAYWKEGLRLDTADKAFQLKIGGRIHNDWGFAIEDHALEEALGEDLEDGVEFRRARLYIEGLIYNHVEFKAQYDFAGGDADFRDVYVGLVGLQWIGGIRVGQFKEPFGLEELTSSNYITFMERALVNGAEPSRNTGLMVHNHACDERLTWALGAFKDSDDFGDRKTGDGEYSFTGRLTGLPWYEDDGRSLLHLGAAYSFRDPNDDEVRFRLRPEAHLQPRFVDTGEFLADSLQLVGGEVALVTGPLSLQGEYVRAFASTIGKGRDLTFGGWYVYASYFLTGEHRPYKTSAGAFDKVKPTRNFLHGEDCCGRGAWEVAARYSEVDLNDEEIAGGELNDVTFGLNWYLNPNVRVMFNYVFADLDDAGDAHILQMRFQVFI